MVPLGSVIKMTTPWPAPDAMGHCGAARLSVEPGTWLFHRSRHGTNAEIPETCGSIWPVKENAVQFLAEMKDAKGGLDPF